MKNFNLLLLKIKIQSSFKPYKIALKIALGLGLLVCGFITYALPLDRPDPGFESSKVTTATAFLVGVEDGLIIIFITFCWLASITSSVQTRKFFSKKTACALIFALAPSLIFWLAFPPYLMTPETKKTFLWPIAISLGLSIGVIAIVNGYKFIKNK